MSPRPSCPWPPPARLRRRAPRCHGNRAAPAGNRPPAGRRERAKGEREGGRPGARRPRPGLGRTTPRYTTPLLPPCVGGRPLLEAGSAGGRGADGPEGGHGRLTAEEERQAVAARELRFTFSMEVVSAWAPAVGFTLLPSAGGFLGSTLTKRELPVWYESLQKPSWCPPNWVFAPVWGAIYTSMGYGSYLVWKEVGGFNEKSVIPLGLYTGQLALNWSWTPIFFRAHKMGWGLVTLLLTTGTATATTVSWYKVNKTAAYLMIPYLAWLTLASALNYHVWKDNRDKKQSK